MGTVTAPRLSCKEENPISTTTNVGITNIEQASEDKEVQINSGWSVIDDALFLRTGTEAARPAASKVGREYWPSDGFQIERDTGSAWVPWGPIFPFRDPNLETWAWINQGTASVITTKGGIHLTDPGHASGQNLRVRKKAAPSVPYTVTAFFLPMLYHKTGLRCGVGWRQSSDGKLVTAHFADNDLHIAKMTSATVFSADYTTIPVVEFNGLWIRIADDNTNRIVSLSRDGQNFSAVHSISRSDFMIGDEVLFMVDGNNSATPNLDVSMTLLSWREQ